jgi:hypothetical protein
MVWVVASRKKIKYNGSGACFETSNQIINIESWNIDR